jgi:serine/threonine protein kinase
MLYDTVPSDHGQSLLLMPLYPMSAAAALLALTAEHSAGPQRLRCRDTLAALVAMCGLAGIAAFARAGLAHGDIKPDNLMLTGGAAGVAPCVLIDFGAALPLGQGLREFSRPYGLQHEPAATLSYDLACLASTVALVQYDLLLPVGDGTGGALLAALQALDGAAWHPAEAPRPPGSLAAETCLRLSYRARSSSAGLDLRELRQAAEAVADAASAAGLRVPPMATVWGSGGEG